MGGSKAVSTVGGMRGTCVAELIYLNKFAVERLNSVECVPAGVTLGFVAYQNFTIVLEGEIALQVIRHISRKKAMVAVVARSINHSPRPADIQGVIINEHISDTVADSVEIY